MMKIDLAGQKFGRLIALNETEKRKWGSIVWLCECDCGNSKEVARPQLIGGHNKSCGCSHTKHGDAQSKNHPPARLYRIWLMMRKRCKLPSDRDYKRYGGRGIQVCDTWTKNYLAFKIWALAHGYTEKLTLDRINNDGNYCPENCRWISRKANVRKISRDRKLAIKKAFAQGMLIGLLKGYVLGKMICPYCNNKEAA